jgi:hypothetical protein
MFEMFGQTTALLVIQLERKIEQLLDSECDLEVVLVIVWENATYHIFLDYDPVLTC